jgi:hypothetical protein
MSAACEMAEEALIAKQARINELEKFVKSFLDPEQNGYAVGPFVRDEARRLMGIPPCETGR